VVVDEEERQEIRHVIGGWQLHNSHASSLECLDGVVNDADIVSDNHHVHVLARVGWHLKT
jgi:hypothetical protein